MELTPVLGFAALVYLAGPDQALHWSRTPSIILGTVTLYVFVRSVRLHHRHEDVADDSSRDLVGGDAMAAALERLAQLNLQPVVTAGKRKTHPDVYDRVVRLGRTPDYPRPEPPKPLRVFVPSLAVVLLTTTWIVGVTGVVGLAPVSPTTKGFIEAAMFRGRNVPTLAEHLQGSGRGEDAAVLRRWTSLSRSSGSAE